MGNNNISYHLGSELKTNQCIIFPIHCRLQNPGETEGTTFYNVGHFCYNNDRTVDVNLPRNVKLTQAEQLFKDIRRLLAGEI